MDIELQNISTTAPLIRYIGKSVQYTQEDKLFSKFGFIHVAVQGDRSKTPVFTFHDIGLNHKSNFEIFFSHHEMEKICENICIYHINAPGQEEGAEPYGSKRPYPSMDEMANLLCLVMNYYDIVKFIGFGVGAGANILTRFAVQNPLNVEGLFLINPTSEKGSWDEWFYQYRNCQNLETSGMTANVIDYLLWHHLGRTGNCGNFDVEYIFKNYFNSIAQPSNLASFITSYVWRTTIEDKPKSPIEAQKIDSQFHMKHIWNMLNIEYFKIQKLSIKCPVFLMTGVYSPHVQATEDMFGRIGRPDCQMSKISDCGMVLEENPSKVAQTFALYLQELGYFFKNLRKKSLKK